MYDFYPEWGPARNRDGDEPQPAVRRPRYWQTDTSQRVHARVGATGPEVRDAHFQRPDDN